LTKISDEFPKYRKIVLKNVFIPSLCIIHKGHLVVHIVLSVFVNFSSNALSRLGKNAIVLFGSMSNMFNSASV